jgi:hypothetical protein
VSARLAPEREGGGSSIACVRGSTDGQLNIKGQKGCGWCEACVVYALDARDQKPCAGKKRGVRLRAVVAVAPRSGGGRCATRRCEDCVGPTGGTLHEAMGHDVWVGYLLLPLPGEQSRERHSTLDRTSKVVVVPVHTRTLPPILRAAHATMLYSRLSCRCARAPLGRACFLSGGGSKPYSHALREPSRRCTFALHIYMLLLLYIRSSSHSALLPAHVFMLTAPLSPRTAHCREAKTRLYHGSSARCVRSGDMRVRLPANDLRIPIRYLLPLSHTQRSSVRHGQH